MSPLHISHYEQTHHLSCPFTSLKREMEMESCTKTAHGADCSGTHNKTSSLNVKPQLTLQKNMSGCLLLLVSQNICTIRLASRRSGNPPSLCNYAKRGRPANAFPPHPQKEHVWGRVRWGERPSLPSPKGFFISKIINGKWSIVSNFRKFQNVSQTYEPSLEWSSQKKRPSL